MLLGSNYEKAADYLTSDYTPSIFISALHLACRSKGGGWLIFQMRQAQLTISSFYFVKTIRGVIEIFDE